VLLHEAQGLTMNAPGVLLSICVPTYRRLAYLRELLPGLVRQVENAAAARRPVELMVCDNASPDGTGAYVRELAPGRIRYFRNRVNVGGDRNFLQCIRRARGAYVWLVGDDEIVAPGAVETVVDVLARRRPDLLILNDPKLVRLPGSPAEFPDYAACIRSIRQPPHFALCHGLISRNVFRRDRFCMREGRRKLWTNMAHMYGLLDGLAQSGPVIVLDNVCREREHRPDLAAWPLLLCIKQGLYMRCVARRFGVSHLRRAAWRFLLGAPVEVAYVVAMRLGLLRLRHAWRMRRRGAGAGVT
jgi:glycosyltransferase involved in cell wall biosynthesis